MFKTITSVDPGGSTIDTRRINSQLSLLHGKVITSVDLGVHFSPTSAPEKGGSLWPPETFRA